MLNESSNKNGLGIAISNTSQALRVGEPSSMAARVKAVKTHVGSLWVLDSRYDHSDHASGLHACHHDTSWKKENDAIFSGMPRAEIPIRHPFRTCKLNQCSSTNHGGRPVLCASSPSLPPIYD